MALALHNIDQHFKSGFPGYLCLLHGLEVHMEKLFVFGRHPRFYELLDVLVKVNLGGCDHADGGGISCLAFDGFKYFLEVDAAGTGELEVFYRDIPAEGHHFKSGNVVDKIFEFGMSIRFPFWIWHVVVVFGEKNVRLKYIKVLPCRQKGIFAKAVF